MYSSALQLSEIENYLNSKGLECYIKGDEIEFPCPHGDCDTNRKHPNRKDFHCSINTQTGQYHCVKCGSKGNLITLKQHFGDYVPTVKYGKAKNNYASMYRDDYNQIANCCHWDLLNDFPEYKQYFLDRGISKSNITEYGLGCIKLYNKLWLTIPITQNYECVGLKLRRPPDDENRDPKYKFYHESPETAIFGGDELLESSSDSVLICGGELDKIIADQMDFGMPAISGINGEATFKDIWIETYLQGKRNIYICFDADETGHKATILLVDKLQAKCPNASIFKIVIPESLGEKADLTDANLAGITAKELLSSVEFMGGMEPIDVNSFEEMPIEKLEKILGMTIKYDNINKIVLFLAMLTTYTEEDQLNVFLNARSSSGKSYIVQEVAKLFPEEDILDFCKVTPKAFFYNEENMFINDDGEKCLNLSRKILIFYDQMDPQLQMNLRSLLSHDKKKLPYMNTNKGRNGANVAETVYILGFPSTFFCSANMQMDEQEQTRAFLLSPEITQEKINASIDLVGLKMDNKSAYDDYLNENKDRRLLIDRIRYIKNMDIRNINIPKKYKIAERFKEMFVRLEPRAQRDISHLGSLIKAVALLNAPFREITDDKDLVVLQNDVDQAFKLWGYLDRSQKYGISPQALDFYEDTILPAFKEKLKTGKTQGITLKELNSYNAKTTGVVLNINFCRNQYIPTLEASGLISLEKNPNNKKENLIIPLKLGEEQSQDSKENNNDKEGKTGINYEYRGR